MSLAAAAAHRAWRAASRPASRRFRAALDDPAGAQERRLRQYLHENRDTVFGRMHGFARIGSIAEYQRRVPICTYDDLQPYVDRLAAGERNVLTAEAVRRLQPSSGSAAAAKLIPYTRTLQREISAAIDPWIANLYATCPGVLGGRAYWSVSPPPAPAAARATAPVPIGFEDDSRYLGGVRAWLARGTLVVPPVVRSESFDRAAFHRVTSTSLLLARDLRLISVWHPSFLSLLLDALADDRAAILEGVARRDWRRAAELRDVRPDDVRRIWPSLAVVSCWGDGASRAPAAALRARLAGVHVQRKGLMATEGVITIPHGDMHPVAVRSHFYEFAGDDGRARLVQELEVGCEYGVVLTTGGGLYRYQLGDRVRVDGIVGRTPSLTFVGRDDRVCDTVGEKLSDGFVARALERLWSDGDRPAFAMLAPDEGDADGRRAYVLFVDRDLAGRRPNLAVELDLELRRNPHYAWCVDLGQLRPARVVPVGSEAARAYFDACVARGRRAGDVKPVCLDGSPDWQRVLAC